MNLFTRRLRVIAQHFIPVGNFVSPFDRPSSTAADLSRRKQYKHRQAGEVPTSTKVAVALSVVLGLFMAIVLVALYRRRRQQRLSRISLSRHLLPPPRPGPTDSPTPLISPTISRFGPENAPLTPPARLQERKLLPSPVLLRPSENKQSRERDSFSPSGFRPPGFNNRRGNKTNVHISPDYIEENLPRAANSQYSRGGSGNKMSLHGSVNGLASTTSGTPTDILTSSNESPSGPSSPKRSYSPYSASFAVGRLIASPGPPPTKALPCTPPETPGTPSSSPPMSPRVAARRHGNIGMAIGTASNYAEEGEDLPKESRDLCDLTEEYARESGHNSWGSWSGSGGGGPGVAISSPRRERAGEMSTPVLEEEDLERLAGGY